MLGGDRMKILVAGSEGMIGSNVFGQISNRHNCKAYKADLKISCDLRKPEICDEVVDGMDSVFHLADRTVGIGYSSTHHGRMLTDSLLISLNLLEAARKAGVKDYLYVSSSCVYSDDLGHPVEEEEVNNLQPPEESNQGYGWAKRIAELQCRYYVNEYGMRIVIARPANIYGTSYDWSRPVEDMHVIPALISKMLRGDKEIVVWGSGRHTRTFQYEADAARLMVELMDKGVSGEAYNLGGEEMSIRDLASHLKSFTGWEGNLVFDTSKPEGPKRKAQDTSKLLSVTGTGRVTYGLGITVEAARKALYGSG
jgi:GDP-L-fucose synthase